MEKYAVDTSDPTAADSKIASQGRTCSICGQSPERTGSVLSCPTHGTEGFERKRLQR